MIFIELIAKARDLAKEVSFNGSPALCSEMLDNLDEIEQEYDDVLELAKSWERERDQLLKKIIHARGLLLANNHIGAERTLYEALGEKWPDTTRGEYEKRAALNPARSSAGEAAEEKPGWETCPECGKRVSHLNRDTCVCWVCS